MSGRDKGGYTEGDGDEDEGGPQALPGGGGKLEPVEKHVAHPWLIEGRVTHGGLCADILVKDGHGDHGLRGVQHVVHHDEEFAVHSLDWREGIFDDEMGFFGGFIWFIWSVDRAWNIG